MKIVTDGVMRAARWRETALDIATDLAARNAVWFEDMCAFHGATVPESPDHPARFRSMGGDVYEGSAGIARFLGAAAECSGDAKLRATALGAIRHALATVDGWSLFTGGAGIGLTALELAERLDEPSLVVPGTQLMERASEAALNADGPYDLLVGTAGVVVGLAAARRYDLDGAWRARAAALGRRLLAVSVREGLPSEDGPPLSWPLHAGSELRLCGLAHGASGIALALEALASLEPDAGWRAAARCARDFERAHYSIEAGSWADLRTTESAPIYPHMWCHGSVGVVAERLAAITHDPLACADAMGGLGGARAYAEGLLASPIGPGGTDALNASVCHGLAGLIELFVDTWRHTADTSWIALASELGDLMMNDGRSRGAFRSGIPGGWPAPGLMLGAAGTGWSLLRLADPEQLTSAWRFGPHTN